ncbi:MAG: gluconate 2-dehydrogenase subunit 3 family protein [Candidatus Sulfotelmatobacter sp.]
MQPAYRLSRRKFLQAAMVAAAAAGSGIACSTGKSPWRFLSVDEAKTLASICDQIIPPDQDPGAAWAGVVNYIDRQLCGPLRHLRNSYRQGIAAVDASSRTLYGANFVALAESKQVELLRLMEQGQAPSEAWKQVSSTEFFALLVDHTMQGFYGDPRHGGNREGVSWKILGTAYPPIRGRLHYDVNVANVNVPKIKDDNVDQSPRTKPVSAANSKVK